MIRILFGLIASLGLLMALGTVLARNLVHAALFLVAFFFLVACQFVLLEAEFLATMQVLVYIGAVAILLMFGIMLTRNIQGDETTGGHWARRLPAGVVALGLLAVLVAGIVDEKAVGNRPAWSSLVVRPEAKIPTEGGPAVDGRSAAISDMAKHVGPELLGRYAIPFEVAGLLLTATLVGAIALAQSDEREDAPRYGAAADVRGGTTDDPGLHNGHGASPATAVLGRAELSPLSDATRK